MLLLIRLYKNVVSSSGSEVAIGTTNPGTVSLGFRPSYVTAHVYEPSNNNIQVAFIYNADKNISKVGILGIAPNAGTYGGSFVNLGTTIRIFGSSFSFNLTDDGFTIGSPSFSAQFYYFAIKK